VFAAVAVALVVVMLASVELFGETHEAEGHEGGESVPADTGGGGQGDAAAGQEIFVANCGSCHTLAEAGTTGAVGPNLDEATLDADAVVAQVTNGGGAMPAFEGTLSEEQIQDVAAFVVASEG
jgi:mono/diheme cytochrome c family protein